MIWSEVTAADGYVVVAQDIQSERYVLSEDVQAAELTLDFDPAPGTYRFWVKVLSVEHPQPGVRSRPIELHISSASDADRVARLSQLSGHQLLPVKADESRVVFSNAEAVPVAVVDDPIESHRRTIRPEIDSSTLANNSDLDAVFADPAENLFQL